MSKLFVQVERVEDLMGRVDNYFEGGRVMTVEEWKRKNPPIQRKPITNADRIRAMSDEELAELLEIIPHCGGPAIYTLDGFCIDDGLKTKKKWLNWLKEEAKDG